MEIFGLGTHKIERQKPREAARIGREQAVRSAAGTAGRA
jgi:hypothetical protein